MQLKNLNLIMKRQTRRKKSNAANVGLNYKAE